MDTTAHREIVYLWDNTTLDLCMFDADSYNFFATQPQQHSAVVQLTLSALSRMLIYIAVFEFIYSEKSVPFPVSIQL